MRPLLADAAVVLTLDGEVDDARMEQVRTIAESLLSNPVIEDFTIEVTR